VRIEPRAEPTCEGFGCWLDEGGDEEANDDDDHDEQVVVDDELAGAPATEQEDGPYFFVEFPDVRRASLYDLLRVWPTEYIEPLPYVVRSVLWFVRWCGVG
jgi:hypothetical protein